MAAPSGSLDWRRALRLHWRLLSGELGVVREAAQTESDTKPTLAVLMLGILAASLGAWLFVVVDSGASGVGGPALRILLLGTLAALGGWMLWVGAIWKALDSLFEVEVDARSLMRAMALVGGMSVWQILLFAGSASFAIGLVATMVGVLLSVLAVEPPRLRQTIAPPSSASSEASASTPW